MSEEQSTPTQPHDVMQLSEKAINNWRWWAQRQLNTDGMARERQKESLDAIFDAAIVGMGQVQQDKAAMRRSMAAHLRQWAESLETYADDEGVTAL